MDFWHSAWVPLMGKLEDLLYGAVYKPPPRNTKKHPRSRRQKKTSKTQTKRLLFLCASSCMHFWDSHCVPLTRKPDDLLYGAGHRPPPRNTKKTSTKQTTKNIKNTNKTPTFFVCRFVHGFLAFSLLLPLAVSPR